MRRIIRWGLYLVTFLAVWFAALRDVFGPLPKNVRVVVTPLPLYLLVAFGCYSLFTISLKLMFFRESPLAALELEKEREQALAELRSAGIDVDEKKGQ